MPRPAALTVAYLVAVLAGLASIGLLTATYLSAKNWLDGIVAGTTTETDGDPVSDSVQKVADVGNKVSLGALAVLLLLFLGLTALWLAYGSRMAKGSRGARGFLTFLAIAWLVSNLIELGIILAGFPAMGRWLADAYDMAMPGTFQLLGLVQVAVTSLAAIMYLILSRTSAATAYLNAHQRPTR